MKRLYLPLLVFLVLLRTPLSVQASELLVFSTNEILTLPIANHETIAIDKKDFISIKDQGKKLLLHGKRPGESVLRIGNIIYRVVVCDALKVKTFKTLKSILAHTQGLDLTYSNNYFRIQGRLDHASTWITIGQQNLSEFLMEAEVSPHQLRMAEHFINKFLLRSGYFPVRILREPFPTVRLPKAVAHTHQIAEILGQFGIAIKEDNKRLYSEPLVRVQVLLLEVRKSYSQQIGIEWPYQMSAKILSDGAIVGTEGAKLTANYFSQSGNGRILASPVLLAKSGSEANFFAGGEFPIKTKTRQTQTIIWKKYGIALKIKPLADPDGKISLDLTSEVSSIDSGEKIDGIPSLFSNNLSSHFDLHHSQTIVLSGLIKKVGGESLKQWPGIGDIPILGSLFTSRDYQEDKTELLVLVSPEIVTQE